MTQLTFAFNNQYQKGQLELFNKELFDNRIERLRKSIWLSYRLNGWRPYRLDLIKECVNIFKVNHETVFNHFEDLLCLHQSQSESPAE